MRTFYYILGQVKCMFYCISREMGFQTFYTNGFYHSVSLNSCYDFIICLYYSSLIEKVSTGPAAVLYFILESIFLFLNVSFYLQDSLVLSFELFVGGSLTIKKLISDDCLAVAVVHMTMKFLGAQREEGWCEEKKDSWGMAEWAEDKINDDSRQSLSVHLWRRIEILIRSPNTHLNKKRGAVLLCGRIFTYSVALFCERACVS